MIKLIAIALCSCLVIRHAVAEENATATETATTSAEEIAYDSYRLPKSITPENYKLEVITHLNDTESEGFLFRGIVWITVSVAKSEFDSFDGAR